MNIANVLIYKSFNYISEFILFLFFYYGSVLFAIRNSVYVVNAY